MVEMFNYHQYTILAPTDEAFRKLPKWKQDRLFKSPNLVSFLLQHYVRTNPPREYNYLRGLKAGTKVSERANASVERRMATVYPPALRQGITDQIVQLPAWLEGWDLEGE